MKFVFILSYIILFVEFHDEKLHNVVKRKVWPYQKFILDDNDLWIGTILEKTVTEAMQVETRDSWWNENNKKVLKKLTSIRNNCINLMKKNWNVSVWR